MLPHRTEAPILTPFQLQLPSNSTLGLYIHVPFCRKACHYCDFYFTPRASLMEAYTEALIQEIHHYLPLLEAAPIETVFFGGGTPSWLPLSLWERLFTALRQLSTFSPREVSLEANPEDLTLSRLSAWKDMGVTRLSVGIQSFAPEVLKTLGRWHNPERAYTALEWVAQTGFASWSVDLIFAVPGQTLESLEGDLRTLMQWAAPHISLYGLTLEPRTVLYRKQQQGKFMPVSDELYGQLYLLAHQMLAQGGYQWYELSNWAKPGHECQHNWRYWIRQPYIGLGPSAHSYIPEVRWWNPRSLSTYLSKLQAGQLPLEDAEALTPTQIEQERWLTQFRTRIGIEKADLKPLGPRAPKLLQEWQAKEWVQDKGNAIVLSPQGALIADHLVKQLFA